MAGKRREGRAIRVRGGKEGEMEGGRGIRGGRKKGVERRCERGKGDREEDRCCCYPLTEQASGQHNPLPLPPISLS